MSSSPNICTPTFQTSSDYFTLKGYSHQPQATTNTNATTNSNITSNDTNNINSTDSGRTSRSDTNLGRSHSSHSKSEVDVPSETVVPSETIVPTDGYMFPQPGQDLYVTTPFTFQAKLNRNNGSPSYKSYNDSTSFTSDSTTSDSFFLKHKGRNDSSNSASTLIDDSPVKLQHELPKLSINENVECDFHTTTPITHNHQINTNPITLNTNRDSNIMSNSNTPITTHPSPVTPYTPSNITTTTNTAELPPSSPKFRSNSLGFNHLSHPTLTKYMTSPNLKTFNDVRKQPQDYLAMIKGLSSNIDLLDNNGLLDLLSKVEIVPEIGLPNLLIIDIRTYTEYVNNHFANAINLSLPSTLLRRSNFSFMRVINSLPTYERLLLKTYFNFEAQNKQDGLVWEKLGQISCGLNGYPNFLVYDNNANSMNMYNILKKVVEQFTPRTQRVYVINEPFADISESLSKLGHLEQGNKQHFDINELLKNDTNLYKDIVINGIEKPRDSLRPADLNTNIPTRSDLGSDRVRSLSLNEIPRVNPSPVESSTPILSNFKLPSLTTATPKFKIRHNEEVIDDTKRLGICLADKYKTNLKNLPSWLSASNIDETVIANQFNKLESNEKNRLNDAFDNGRNGGLLGAGIEKGYKNRYKDILIFEHSRVRLNDFGEVKPSKICDYINASYINSVDKVIPYNEGVVHQQKYFKYIASQGPLQHTIGDFYKMLINNDTRIIVSLTDEWENGMVKCEPYWVPGTYKSNENVITVTVNHVEKINEGLIIRLLDVDSESGSKTIIQLQLLDWLDNDICSNLKNLLFIIKLKNQLIADLNLGDFASLVHCSAGCGRTGTFITVDTLTKLIETGYPITDDSTFNIVDGLRRQRISMVQNLRQYLSIFEILINVFLQKGDIDIHRNIVKDFKNKIRVK